MKVYRNSLREKVLQTVLSLGECTIGQVLAEVGGSISAAMAARAAQTEYRLYLKRYNRPDNRTTKNIVSRGRRRLVTECLRRLALKGKLERVARGVYRTPQPKIYQPGQAI